jgi:hypothetical protein
MDFSCHQYLRVRILGYALSIYVPRITDKDQLLLTIDPVPYSTQLPGTEDEVTRTTKQSAGNPNFINTSKIHK